jgi:putative hemolysin
MHIRWKKNYYFCQAMKLVDIKDFETVSPMFRGKLGNRLSQFVMRLFGIDKVNRVYDPLSECKAQEFASRWLDETGVNYTVGNAERLKELPEGAFIVISNHPYGGLDGFIMMDIFSGIRPDVRFMVNKILMMVKPFRGNLISVTPAGNKKSAVSSTSLSGVRETLKMLREGHPVGFFPSGAVSDFSLKELRVRDREWQESVLNLIRHAKVPVLPVRLFDKNSLLFYFLGVIHWRIRLIRMPHELFNKGKKLHHVGIGNLITVEEQEHFTNVKSLGEFLRKAVYEMPFPDQFIHRKQLNIL